MKKNGLILWLLGLLMTISFIGITHAQQYKFKLAHAWPTGNINHVANVYWAEQVSKLTNGKVKITIYPAQQLVKARQMVPATSKGTIDMAVMPGPYFAGRMPLIDIDWLPMLYKTETMAQARQAGIDAMLSEEFEKVLNVKMITSYQGGTSEIWTVKQKVETLEDMKGLLIRGAGGALTQIVRALGATPVTVSGAEVFTALQRGTIDGSLWTTSSYIANKVWEVTKFGTRLSRPFIPGFVELGMNLDKWNRLPPDVQKAMLEAGKKMQVWAIDLAAKKDKELWQRATQGGMTITQLSAREEARWEEKAHQVWDWYVKRAGDRGRQLLEIAKRYK